VKIFIRKLIRETKMKFNRRINDNSNKGIRKKFNRMIRDSPIENRKMLPQENFTRKITENRENEETKETLTKKENLMRILILLLILVIDRMRSNGRGLFLHPQNREMIDEKGKGNIGQKKELNQTINQLLCLTSLIHSKRKRMERGKPKQRETIELK